MPNSLQTDRTTVHRLNGRASYDRELIYRILDEAFFCHVGFVVDGSPVVLPTIHWRDGDTLYLHGSVATRMLRSLRDGAEACVTITLLDGLVLARSAFHHSMNYRSVVIMAKAREVTGEEKVRALSSLVEHVCRGRAGDARGPNDIELKQTLVLALPIEEASAKVRTGGPADDEEDYRLPVWAGVLPLRTVPQTPVADDRLDPTTPVPEYISRYRRPGW